MLITKLGLGEKEPLVPAFKEVNKKLPVSLKKGHVSVVGVLAGVQDRLCKRGSILKDCL